jgi:hypothetical protein
MSRSLPSRGVCLLAMLGAGQLLSARTAQAQDSTRADTQGQAELDPHFKPATRRFESPERFMVELHGGPYTPDLENQSYGRYFQGDSGPNLGVQVDGIVYRQPKTFYLTVGGGLGLLNFSGDATATATGVTVAEKTTLSIVPLMATVGFRLDVLPRRLHIPLILGARLGWEWAHWDTNTGARNDASGWSLGPVISAQVAIDLDSFESSSARNLDEEWGINHTYVFGEVFRFAPVGSQLPIGTTSWLLGLGLVF